MLWEVKILPKLAHSRATLGETSSQQSEGNTSSKAPELTIWNDIVHEDESKGFSAIPKAVELHGDSGDVLFYAELSKGSEDLRNTFYMQRRRRPMVLAPTSCPMPDKQRSGERRDRLYLLYLQPWVLESSWALPGIVPHICCLNQVQDQTCEKGTCSYSYSEAWKKYISKNIVSARTSHHCAIHGCLLRQVEDYGSAARGCNTRQHA